MSKANVHTETLDLNWELISLISEIDRFDASWKAIERKEGQSLKRVLKPFTGYTPFKKIWLPMDQVCQF